jgi:hypothetical protein
LLQSCSEAGFGERGYRGIDRRLVLWRFQTGRPDAYFLNFNAARGIQSLGYAPNTRPAMHAIDAQYELCHDVLLFPLMILARNRLSETDNVSRWRSFRL